MLMALPTSTFVYNIRSPVDVYRHRDIIRTVETVALPFQMQYLHGQRLLVYSVSLAFAKSGAPA